MTATNNKRILIVDDNEEISEVIGMVLRDEGYDAHSHPTGNELIITMLAVKPDLILMDIIMVIMTGASFAGF